MDREAFNQKLSSTGLPVIVDVWAPLCATLREGWILYKVARSSGPIQGSILFTNWSGFIDYPFGRRLFKNQVLIQGVDHAASLPGDSGSVWITSSGYAAALNFSATDRKGQYSIASPIHTVLEAFGMRVALPAIMH